jgi:hypothetical protein
MKKKAYIPTPNGNIKIKKRTLTIERIWLLILTLLVLLGATLDEPMRDWTGFRGLSINYGTTYDANYPMDVNGLGRVTGLLVNDPTYDANYPLDVNGPARVTDCNILGVMSWDQVTIDPCDTTPDVSGGNVFVTSANGQATAITDLDNPTPGQVIIIMGGSDTNSSTIADSGNFALNGAWTAALDDSIMLLVQADNDYVEIGTRGDN